MAGSVRQTTNWGSNIGPTSGVLNFPVATLAGSCIVVYIFDGSNSTVTIGASDGANTYGALDTINDSNNGNTIGALRAINAASVTSVTATSNSGGTYNAVAVEITGVTTTPVDGQNAQYQSNPGASANAISSGTATNANTAFALALTAILHDAVDDTPTAGTGYTSTTSGNVIANGWPSGGHNEGVLEWKASVAAGTHTNAATFTDATGGGSGNSYATFIVYLDESGGSTTALVGTMGAVATDGGTLGVANALGGSLAAKSTFGATLSISNALAGAVSTVATNGGSAGIAIGLAGTSYAVAGNGGTLGNAISLTGSAGAVGTYSGALSDAIALSGGIFAVARWSGSLNAGNAAQLAGAIGAISTWSGTLSVATALAGPLGAVATNIPLLALSISLAAPSQAVATNTGTLSTSILNALAGTLGAKATFGGALSNAIALAGTLNADSTLGATLGIRISLAGTMSAIATLVGSFALPFYRGEMIDLPDDMMRITLQDPDVRMTLDPDQSSRIALLFGWKLPQ